jgi:hypothetical protein
MPSDAISVLDACCPGEASIFRLCEEPINLESIYDNAGFKNKTRFSALPSKLQKGNLPVTFNKKIKSSGYSGTPSAMKYSTTQKAKKAQVMKDWLQVSKDMGKPLAMTIPNEC